MRSFAYRWQLILMKLLLGPLLLYQGKRVRKHTPILPEPCAIKFGVKGSGKSLRLLLLGDSSAAGVGAACCEETLLGQLLKNLSPNYQVHFKLMAKTGCTSAAMIQQLDAAEAKHYDVVITALGVNDVTAQVPVSVWIQQQQQLIEQIKQLYKPRKLIFSGLPPVAEFPALPWPLNSYLGIHANQLNHALSTLIHKTQELDFLSLRDFPETAMPATDGFHPGPSVYHLWAQYLSDLIQGHDI